MSNGPVHSAGAFGESGFDLDPEVDPDELVESMDPATGRAKADRKGQNSRRRMIEDRQEARRLRSNLEDWDDWELDTRGY